MLKSLQNQISKIKKSIANQNITDNSMVTYGKLNEIEHSLYRYDQLSKAGLRDEAKTESTRANNFINDFNATEEGIVLKGGISNAIYVWVAEDDACEECQAMDGTEYDNPDDAPFPLHPNCKCHIEEFEDDGENDDEDEDEPCDCVERLDALIAELEEGQSEAESVESELQTEIEDLEKMTSRAENIIEEMNETLSILEDEYGQHLPDCENNIDAIYDEISGKVEEVQSLLQDILDLLETTVAYLKVFAVFCSNYVKLLYHAYVLKESGMDKYYHSVANCQSAQFGELEEEAATVLSDFKEEFDQYNNNYATSHKLTLEQALADSERDQVANRLGRERGRNNPTCDCRILMRDVLPENKR